MAKNNCTDCWYRKKVGGMPYCDYFLSTGNRRPCPAGAGCTVKISRKVYRKKRRYAVGKAKMLGMNKPYIPNSRADRRWVNKSRRGTTTPQSCCSRDSSPDKGEPRALRAGGQQKGRKTEC